MAECFPRPGHRIVDRQRVISYRSRNREFRDRRDLRQVGSTGRRTDCPHHGELGGSSEHSKAEVEGRAAPLLRRSRTAARGGKVVARPPSCRIKSPSLRPVRNASTLVWNFTSKISSVKAKL